MKNIFRVIPMMKNALEEIRNALPCVCIAMNDSFQMKCKRQIDRGLDDTTSYILWRTAGSVVRFRCDLRL